MKFSILLLSAFLGTGILAQAQAAVGPGCAIRTDGSSICAGDRIIDYRNVTGFVNHMLPNGIMAVHYDDGTDYAVNPYYLYREVGLLEGYGFGTRVYDSHGNLGTIFDLFENGIAEITLDGFPGQYFVLNVNQLQNAGLPSVPITHPWPGPRPYPDPVTPQPVPAPQPYPNR